MRDDPELKEPVQNVVKAMRMVERCPVVIVGDFSAWAVEWISQQTNATRRYSLPDALTQLDVKLCNVGIVNKFRKDGHESIIDIDVL